MDIVLDTAYKSLEPFGSSGLADKLVVVGPNGSGKSHLLEAIGTGAARITRNGNELGPGIVLPPDSLPLPAELSSQTVSTEEVRRYLRPVLEAFVAYKSTNDPVVDFYLDERGRTKIDLVGAEPIFDRFDLAQDIEAVGAFCLDRPDAFSNDTRVALSFLRYKMLQQALEEREVAPELIVDSIGNAPWDQANLALERADLTHRAVEPDLTEYRAPGWLLDGVDVRYSIEVARTGDDSSYPLTSLSSGERQMLGLAVFIASNSGADAPMLLDEPDRSLHPDWLPHMLKLLSQVSTPILLATHRSETVVSSFEDFGHVVLRRPTRMDAVDVAAAHASIGGNSFLPPSNERIVVVEGPDDVTWYNEFQVIAASLQREPSNLVPRYLEASRLFGSGGREALQRGVEAIGDASESIRRWITAQVDRDFEFGPLSQLDRYELENYIYDPLMCLLSAVAATPPGRRRLTINGTAFNTSVSTQADIEDLPRTLGIVSGWMWNAIQESSRSALQATFERLNRGETNPTQLR